MLVVYPQFIKGIIPLAITNDDGKTWKKIDFKDEAQKSSYMSASKNMNLAQNRHINFREGNVLIDKIEDQIANSDNTFIASKENPVFIINMYGEERLSLQKGKGCQGTFLNDLAKVSYKALKFMGLEFIKDGKYSFFSTNDEVYYGKKIPDSNELHRALAVKFEDIIRDLIKDGSNERMQSLLKTEGIIIYSIDGITYCLIASHNENFYFTAYPSASEYIQIVGKIDATF